MKISRPLLLAVVFYPAVGWAHTAGINPLPLIAHYESGGNPTINNATLGSSASGLYQMVSGTWAEALQDCGCGTTVQYPNAASAPASVQTAAAAGLINTNGLNDWTCPGCDAPFSAAVNAAGGTGAYQTSGLSTNPADYASLDTATGLSSFMAGTTTAGSTVAVGSGGLTVSETDGSTGGSTPGNTATIPPVTAGSSASTPFSWVWNQYQSAVETPISNDIGTVLQAAAQPLGTLLVLSLAIVGILIAVGMNNFNHLWRKFFKILVVVGLVGTANVYQSDFVAAATSFPTWLTQAVGSGSTTGPAGSFDNVSATFLAAVHTAWAQVPWGTEMFLDAGLFAIAFVIVYGAEIFMFGVWFISQVILQILLIIGPVAALTLLSEYLSDIFVKYVKLLLLVAVVAFVVNVMVVLGPVMT
ncbi:MAG: type IV secretion system protein [Stellaceae bacterium]